MKNFLWISAALVSLIFSSCSGRKEINNNDIDINKFQKRYNEALTYNKDTDHKDSTLLKYFVLEELVYEKLLDNEYELNGIDVTSSEVETVIYDDPQINFYFVEQLGFPSARDAKEMIANPLKYQIDPMLADSLRNDWKKIEKTVVEDIKIKKLQNIIYSCIQPNNLDVKAIREGNKIMEIALVGQNYSDLKDDDFKVSDTEIEKLYNKYKERYKVKNEIRKVAYISIGVKPSEKDVKHAHTLIDSLSEQLKSEKGIESAKLNKEVFVKEAIGTMETSKTEPWLNSFLADAEVGNVSPTQDYTEELIFAKLLDKKEEPDSINVDIVVIYGSEALQDSTINELNNGKTISMVSGDNIQGQENTWLNLLKVDEQSYEEKEKLLKADEKKFFILKRDDKSAFAYRVNKRNSPKKIFTYATVSCQVAPSKETYSGLINGIETYISKNNNAETFIANADSAGYKLSTTYLTNDMPNLCHMHDIKDAQNFQDRMINISGHHAGGVSNSHNTVQWVFSNSKGSVSPIFEKKNEHGSKIIAVAVADVINKGYVPFNEHSIKEDLTREIIRDKKAEKIISTLPKDAADMKSYAAALKCEIDSTTANSENGLIPAVGIEYGLTGAVSGTANGAISKPFKGKNGVYVFQIQNNENKESLFSETDATNLFRQKFSETVVRQLFQVLRTDVNVNTNLDNF